MTVLISGATGSVGRLLIAQLLRRGVAVRAMSRKAEPGLPVQSVLADVTRPDTLTADLFDGVTALFVFPFPQGVPELIDGAMEAGVGRFVVLSSLAVSARSPRDVGSASQRHHAAVEAAVTSRTDGWTMLRPGTFADNLLSWAPLIQRGMPIRAPYIHSAQAPIHEADVADVAAAALTDGRHTGAVYELTGPEALTRVEQVAAISAAIGRPVDLVEVSPEQFRQETEAFLPGPIADMLLDYWRDTVDEPDVPTHTVEAVTGRRARTLRDWAADHAEQFSTQPVVAQR